MKCLFHEDSGFYLLRMGERGRGNGVKRETNEMN